MKKSGLILCLIVFTVVIITPACKNGTNPADKSASASESMEVMNAVVVRPTSADSKDTIKTSIKAIAKGSVRGATLVLNYNSPAVRERKIWGSLVPYDKIWVTGAHMATSLECNKEFNIGNTKVPPGKYALFTIPGVQNWVVIINKNWDQHLTDEYSSGDDIASIEVQPEQLAKHQERLMYEFDQTGERSVSIRMKWEKIGISVPMEIR